MGYYSLAALRTMLTEQLEYYGHGSFQDQLDNAYADFIAYARRNKLDHSQPPFKASKVFWHIIHI